MVRRIHDDIIQNTNNRVIPTIQTDGLPYRFLKFHMAHGSSIQYYRSAVIECLIKSPSLEKRNIEGRRVIITDTNNSVKIHLILPLSLPPWNTPPVDFGNGT